MFQWLYNKVEDIVPDYDKGELASITSICWFLVLISVIDIILLFVYIYAGVLEMVLMNILLLILFLLTLYLMIYKKKITFPVYLSLTALCLYITYNSYIFGSNGRAATLLIPLFFAVYIILPFNSGHKIFMSCMVFLTFICIVLINYFTPVPYGKGYEFVVIINVVLTIICCLFIIFTNELSLRFIEIFGDKKLNRLKEELYTDALTGLKNRKYLDATYFDVVGIPNTYIVVADIDFFKKVNDNFGHIVGDVVLKRVADVFKKNFRVTDIVIRWGGEEFLILIKDIQFEELIAKVEEVRKIVESEKFNTSIGKFKVTSSFGISELTKELTLEENIVKADKALYKAKLNGRNQFVSYTDDLEELTLKK